MKPPTASMLAKTFGQLGIARVDYADDGLCDLLRRVARALGQRERDVGREVAKLGTARRLERNGRGLSRIRLGNGRRSGVGKGTQRAVQTHALGFFAAT